MAARLVNLSREAVTLFSRRSRSSAGFAPVKSVDVAPLASHIRIFWNLLRLALLPVVAATLSFASNCLKLMADSAKPPTDPILAAAPQIPPLIFVWPVASCLCWLWIGRYGRITTTFVMACISLLPLVLIMDGPYWRLIGSLLSGWSIRPDEQTALVAFLLTNFIPQILLVIAAVQYAGFVSASNDIGRLTQGRPLAGFRRLTRARRQTYRKFKVARLWMLPLAMLGALVTIDVVALIFAPMQEWLNAASESLPDPYDLRLVGAYLAEHIVQMCVLMVATIVGSLAVLAALIWWARFAWLGIRRRATEVLADRSYRPIVFLRSFRDDDAKVRMKSPFWSLLGRRIRLEEVIAGQLMRLGPCVAIGKPGEWVPRHGAMRAYFADADWQTAIRTWTDRALLAVVMAGASPSVLWELEHLIWSDRISSLLLILPPDESTSARAARWSAVAKVFAGTRWQQGVASANVADGLCVTFGADGSVITFNGWSRHQIDYDVAVQAAAVRLLGRG
jgi:hypothetical protein